MKKKTPPIKYSDRRRRNMLVTVLCVAIFTIVISWMNRSLLHGSFVSGYVMLASLFLLAAFGMRKRLPMIGGIGSAAFWMQLHIYVGLASFVVFALHVSFRVPDGMLESILAGLYLCVFGSGMYGLYATRTFPRKLTSLNEEVIYERIPAFRRELARHARTIVLEACQSTPVRLHGASNWANASTTGCGT